MSSTRSISLTSSMNIDSANNKRNLRAQAVATPSRRHRLLASIDDVPRGRAVQHHAPAAGQLQLVRRKILHARSTTDSSITPSGASTSASLTRT